MGFIDLVFPRRCVKCGKLGKYLCSSCISQVPQAKFCCPVCGCFNFQGKTHKSCQTRYSLDGHLSVWSYLGVVRKSILKLKYNFVSDIASELVGVSANRLKINLNWTKYVFVAVPTSQPRGKWRGFNQAEILAEFFAREFGGEYKSNILTKTKNTKPQVQLDKKHRMLNVKDTFSVSKKHELKNRRIILVDDVWTTGSTMREACRILKKAGASEVWGLTVAQ